MQTEVFPADLDHLYDMLGFIKVYGTSQQIESDLLNKIILAAEEALVNIIDYSYPIDKGMVEITCRQSIIKAGINILLKDNGIPFNPISQPSIRKKLPPPLPSLEDPKKGGYGIYIFVGIMDHVEYRRLENGNLLSLTKYFS